MNEDSVVAKTNALAIKHNALQCAAHIYTGFSRKDGCTTSAMQLTINVLDMARAFEQYMKEAT